MNVSEEYLPYIIKDYNNWTLFLNKKQKPYLGRCYAWWKDLWPGQGEGMPPSAIEADATLELNHRIFTDVMRACEALGYKTIPHSENFLLNKNYLANEEIHRHHMHEHFIPRSKITFTAPKLGIIVPNANWGKNYANPEGGEQELDEGTLRAIKSIMVHAIVRP